MELNIHMKVLINDENKAFEEIKNIMYSWKNNDPIYSQKSMYDFFEKLIHSMWNRKRVYDFTFEFIKNNLVDLDYEKIPSEAFDYLGDIELSIIGHCSYDSFLKFPGEPENIDELIYYVRGNIWKND